MELKDSIVKLEEIVAFLRNPETGCPWDKVQTHDSIKRNLVEEVYEVIDALNQNSPEKMKEEFGDLLLQIMFHTQIEREKNNFSINDVILELSEKLVRRHPHVFKNDVSASNPDEVLKIWNKAKDKEKDDAHIERKHVLFDIPDSFPPFLKARKYGERASKVNFDWRSPNDALLKVEEELGEVKEEAHKENINIDRLKEEIGDLLFSIIQYVRKLKLDSEDVLNLACQKYKERFYILEDLANGKDMHEMSDDELNDLWEEAKKERERRKAK